MAAVPEDLELPQLELQVPASDNLGAFVVDGSKAPTAARTYNAPRSFELPTENFVRKTGMRDRGPPGFEYNNPTYLSISATKPGSGLPVFLAPSASRSSTLPGVHVRAYAATPTRNHRLEEAEAAAQARAEQARQIATKSRRDKKIAAANKEAGTGVSGTLWKSPQGLSTVLFNVPRSRATEDHAWREALKAKAQALAASPRAGKPGVIAAARGRRGGAPSKGRRYRRAAAVVKTRGAFQGVKVPADTLKRPFAGGTELDALPGRLESLIFPHRYLDWPKEATLPALAVDIQSSPVRHAVAFHSKQPRIVCHDLQRETHGWDGPGAYEWDEAAASSARNSDSNGNDITDKDHASLGSSTRGLRPRGISIRDPQRESRVFREGSTGFISPCQTNVRGFAVVPASGRGALVREGTGVARGQAEVVSGGDGRGSPSKKQGRGGNSGRKRPQKLWMFQPAGKEYQPAGATGGWGGPGAYDVDSGVRVRIKELGRVSPVFQPGAGRRGPAHWDRDVSVFPAQPGGRTGTAASSPPGDGGRQSPATPDILANWTFSSPEFSPPEPRTIAHDVKKSPVRFGSCFLSVTERFDPVGPCTVASAQAPEWAGPGAARGGGRGERGQGGFGGPVERYDIINARKQPPTSNTWLGTSIRPGVPYNLSLAVDTAAPISTNTAATAINPSGTSCLSQPSPPSHPVTDSSETSVVDTDTIDSGESMARVMATGGSAASGVGTSPLAAVGKAAGIPRRVPAAEAAAAAAAATAAAGLARNWAGSRRDSCGGVEGDGRVRREVRREPPHLSSSGLNRPVGAEFVREAGAGAAGAVGTGLIPSSCSGGPGGSSTSNAVAAATTGRKDGEETGDMIVGAGECPRRDVALSSMLAPVAETTLAATSPAGATIGMRIAASLHQARSQPRKSTTSRKNSNSTAPKTSSGQADGGAKGKRCIADTITQESLAVAEASMTAAAAAAVEEATMGGSGGLIRTVGRAKRGPCMLTLALSSSPHSQTKRRAKKEGAGSTTKGHGRSSSSMARVWETEENGGLLGPGETKVLVC